MTLSEFARTVLFGGRLEDKLVTWDRLTDGVDTDLPEIPEFPPRSPEFRHRAPGEKRPPFPRDDQMVDPSVRARMLLDFANHEMSALELMALMLLRFPGTPAPFRRGLADIMADEQEHLRLYLGRAAELSSETSLSAHSTYFWDHLHRLQDPAVFLAGMSLGFEQANLDFAGDYRNLMVKHGDLKTARILERVLDDEIRHVRFGLHWFRKMAGLTADDELFDRWQTLLPPPLSPRHGKGRHFFAEPRLKAGFSPDYVRRLEVFSASRGRPPRVFVFNPRCESEIAARGTPPQENQVIRTLNDDFSSLPMFFAGADDLVLVARQPTPEFLEPLLNAGFAIPEFMVVPLAREPLAALAAARPLFGELIPWGRSPHIQKLMEPLIRKSPATHAGTGLWCDNWRSAYTKSRAAEFLADYLAHGGRRHVEDGVFAGAETAGVSASSPVEVVAALEASYSLGFDRWVIKADLSMAGRDRLFADRPELTAESAHWIKKTVERDGRVVVEPWLKRRLDLSFHARKTPDGRARFDGSTVFLTDSKGRYVGSWVGGYVPHVCTDLRPFFVRAKTPWNELVQEIIHAVVEGIPELPPGPLGIDAFLFEDRRYGGELRLKPVVEINPRHTMGRVSLMFSRRILRSQPAIWRHLSVADAKCAGFPDLVTCLSEWRKLYPAVFLPSGDGRVLGSGILATTDTTPSTRFTSCLGVGHAAVSALLRGVECRIFENFYNLS